MNPTQLLTHFDRISDAPDAVPRLRRFILDLAVRGKLVEQNAHDEPASELLKRIEEEKSLLVKKEKTKALSHLSVDPVDYTPWNLPVGWKWISLGETVNCHLGGGTPSKNNSSYWDGDIFWASVKDIGKGKYVETTIDRITQEGLANSSSNLIPPGNVIVVTRMGLGKISINRTPMAINQDLRALSLSSFVSIDYFYIFFRTHGFDGTGLTVKGIKIEELLNVAFPLPPSAEQRRIVAKVDELMALCDRLDIARATRETQRDTLNTFSLKRLNQPDTDASTFRADVRFHFKHFPRLTVRPEQIQQLRQSILSLAVRGKLVEQDPKDEPAFELLRQIKEKKARLVKEGEIRNEKALPPIDESVLPMQIPNGWIWTRLGDVARLVTSGSRDWAQFYSDQGAIFVRMGNLSRCSYQMRLNHIQHVKLPTSNEGKRTKLEEGDILISITGDVGLLGLVPPEFGDAYINQHTCLVRMIDPLKNRYLPELFRSPFAQNQFNAPQRGIKNSFRLTDVTEFLVPLPPLAEQHRIVSRVDELMALCDCLEAHLTSTQTMRRQLLKSVLEQALTPVA